MSGICRSPSTTTRPRRPRVLLGVTGSVAAVKAPELAVRLVRDLRCDVAVLLTAGGQNFWGKTPSYDPANWAELQVLEAKGGGNGDALEIELQTNPCGEEKEKSFQGCIHVHAPQDEWKGWNKLGDPVLHITLRDWADVALIAPLSAHTLAKLAAGLCDDTLSCVIRAWDLGHGDRPGKPIVLAPAMNTAMWNHPLTNFQLNTIKSFWNSKPLSKKGGDDVETTGIEVVEPQAKTLACGEVGTGALADVPVIMRAVKKCLA